MASSSSTDQTIHSTSLKVKMGQCHSQAHHQKGETIKEMEVTMMAARLGLPAFFPLLLHQRTSSLFPSIKIRKLTLKMAAYHQDHWILVLMPQHFPFVPFGQRLSKSLMDRTQTRKMTACQNRQRVCSKN